MPQEVPAVLLPLSTHIDAPVEHDVVPVLHRLVGGQATPTAQDTQVPNLQTRFVPQDAPSARDVFVSVQVAAPVEQDSVPR